MDLERRSRKPDQDRLPHRVRGPQRTTGGGAELEAMAGPPHGLGVPGRARLELVSELHPPGRNVRAPTVARLAVSDTPAEIAARPRILDRDPGEVLRRLEEADALGQERLVRRDQLPLLARCRTPDGDASQTHVHVRLPPLPLPLPDQPRLVTERERLIDDLRLPPPVRAESHRPESPAIERVPRLGLPVLLTGQVLACRFAGDLVPSARDLQQVPIPEPPAELEDRLVAREAARVLEALGGVEVRRHEYRPVRGDPPSEVPGERLYVEGTHGEREQRARAPRDRPPGGD